MYLHCTKFHGNQTTLPAAQRPCWALGPWTTTPRMCSAQRQGSHRRVYNVTWLIRNYIPENEASGKDHGIRANLCAKRTEALALWAQRKSDYLSNQNDESKHNGSPTDKVNTQQVNILYLLNGNKPNSDPFVNDKASKEAQSNIRPGVKRIHEHVLAITDGHVLAYEWTRNCWQTFSNWSVKAAGLSYTK